MKVAYFINDSNLYGSNKSMLEIILTLRKKYENFKPLVFLPKDGSLKDELLKNNIRCVELKYFNSIKKIVEKNKIKSYIKIIGNFFLKYKIIKFVKKEKIDLIVSNNSAVSIGAEVAKKTRIKHYWHIREFLEEDHELELIQKNKVLKLFNEANGIVFVSNAVKNKYENVIKKPKIQQVIHNGLDVDSYAQKEVKKYNDIINILISGSINYTKGHTEAIKAVEILIEREIKNIKLYIAGNGVCKEELEKYVKEHNLSQYIIFLGFQKNLYDLRKNINIALVCSKNEAYGRVTVESMLSKNLVIGSNKGGTKELIEDMQTGILYNQGSPEDLADKIEMIIKKEDKYIEIVNSAYEFAYNNLSVNTYVEKIYDIYCKILND